MRCVPPPQQCEPQMPPNSTLQPSPLLHPLPLFCCGGPRWGRGRGPADNCCRPSLNVAATAGASLGIRAVGLRGQGLVEGVEAGVRGQRISPRRHPLINAVQALCLLKAGDLMLRWEALDGCREEMETGEKNGYNLGVILDWEKLDKNKRMGVGRGHTCSHPSTH